MLPDAECIAQRYLMSAMVRSASLSQLEKEVVAYESP